MRTAVVPDKVVGVFVSFVEFNNAQYISGLRFTQRSGASVCIGYQIPADEVPLDIECLGHREEKCRIAELHLAIDPQGCRAIPLITTAGQRSKWVGNHRRVAKKRLLNRNPRSMILKAGLM